MTLADRIKELRRLRGWSQYDLADEVGVRQPTISRLESGEEPSTPVRKLLVMLCDSAGVPSINEAVA